MEKYRKKKKELDDVQFEINLRMAKERGASLYDSPFCE
jgi:hypothetical protein